MAACLYQETRFNIDPAGDVESVFVPSSGGFGSRSYPKRRRVERPAAFDEATFAKQHLATDSSIHFRPNADVYPRAILWRVLDDSQLLELQSIDFWHEKAEKPDTSVTLRFRFDTALLPKGITFAEKSGAHALVIHVITKKGDIVTLTLQDEAFIRPGLLEEGHSASSWWRAHSPSALKIRNPYRATGWNGDRELFISLNDGSVARLAQSDTEDWNESIFSEATWSSSMRGLFKSQTSARYGDVDLGSKAACSAVPSPTGELLWTVCLDHTIRVWSTRSGKVIHTLDLAGIDRDFKQSVTQLLDPYSTELIQVLQFHGRGHHHDRYLLATYSPHARVFKLWRVHEEEGGIDLVDYNSTFTFKPPIDDMIDTVGWQILHFHVKIPRTSKDHYWTLWILVRSGSNAHTFTVNFDPDERSNKLSQQWQRWAEVHPGLGCLPRLKSELDCELAFETDSDVMTGESIVEKWLQWLLKPGYFSHDELETALTIYQQGETGKSDWAKANSATVSLPFEQRLSSALNSLMPTFAFNEDRAFLDHEKQILKQIQVFNGVLEDLHRNREKALTLVYDLTSGLPFHVMADQASVVRSCCDLEIIHHNHEEYSEQQNFTADSLLLKNLSDAAHSNVGVLMHALDLMHDALPDAFLQSLKTTFYTDILKAPTVTIEERMQTIYDETGFEGKLSDDAYDSVGLCIDKLDGWDKLETELFDGLLDLFSQQQRGKAQKKRATAYGARLLVNGAQDTVKLEEDVLLKMLAFIIFAKCELVDTDFALFAPADVYNRLLHLAQERMIASWLAFTENKPKSILTQQMKEKKERTKTDRHTGTLLQRLAIEEWPKMQTPNEATIQLLTYWTRVWTYTHQLDEHGVIRIPYLMSWLLKNSATELAGDFVKFMVSGPWADYVTARYYLQAGEYVEAASLLEAAADQLSANFDVSQYDTCGLLKADEKLSFDDGKDRFYSHVVSLFEQAKASSYAGDFAVKALEQFEKEQSQDSALQREIVARLFTASIQTSRFEQAFMAVTKQTDYAL